ncbi:hypothetical protein H105_03061 [Trichophyton soudanense CBS 452.61]|uniref:non-specific serine/threonine protein kinase n=2 Tax=Trichophyton TaxID=5550 RepID=A0A022XXB0_TRISD|nr:hypothetical protein H104_03037 [Trichophyton rubrum CBS 289.86]EZF75362.1 hypothetical protein H105_03061 [Trichophyton soudanense CBS 452.61]
MMDRLIEHIPDSGFDIWCDDSFLSLTAPPDAPLPPQPHENPHGDTVYWDNRPLEVNGQAWVLMPVPKCNEDLQAFQMDGGFREVIVLCPRMFEHYYDLGEYQVNMASRPPVFPRGIHIDSFATSLMFVLVHEVSHCNLFLQGLATSDVPADTDGYGWNEAVRHADNNHLYALENADNFALFVLAMYLSRNDWSTGLSDDMFADAPAGQFSPIPGGYHPTLIGDSFCDGRYTVVHKLGSGGYSTIWLARDQQLQRYVSLKMLVAGASQDTHESNILQLLSKGNLNGPGKQCIPTLLYQFFSPDGSWISNFQRISMPEFRRLHQRM